MVSTGAGDRPSCRDICASLGGSLRLDIAVLGSYVLSAETKLAREVVAEGPIAPNATGSISVSGDCAVTLVGGNAACHIPDSDFRPGKVQLSVTYGGDANYEGVNVKEPAFDAVLAPSFKSSDSVRVDVLQKLSFLIRTAGSPAATIKESGALPAGVKLRELRLGRALLSGMPALHSKGRYRFRLVAYNGATSVRYFTLIVIATPPSIESALVVTGRIGRKLAFKIRASGIPAVTMSESGDLPKGVHFLIPGKTGAMLAGTPEPGTQGTYLIRIMARNGIGHGANKQLRLRVIGN